MNAVEEVRDMDGRLMAYRVGRETPPGLKSYSADSDFIQVLSWRYPAGRMLSAHAHLDAPRAARITQEAIVVVTGSVRASVFDRDRRLIRAVDVRPGECMAFVDGGHAYEILEDDTRVFEIKNGPYPGPEADRERFCP